MSRRIVGLTGLIGAGKSTVAKMLAGRGAIVLEGDKIGHEIYEPGTQAFREIVAEFGQHVVDAEGRIARPKLGAIVFSDPARLQKLNEITHPHIYARAAELAGRTPDGSIVVYDMYILTDRSRTDEMIVVAAHDDATIAHLTGRGMPEEEARRRLRAQPPLADKLALADHVIWNDGTLEELESRVDEVWKRIVARASA